MAGPKGGEKTVCGGKPFLCEKGGGPIIALVVKGSDKLFEKEERLHK